MRAVLKTAELYIGCAGWQLGREYSADFAVQGSHLERYATRLNAVEINSAFYRPHRPQTYAKWAAAVGSQFRFSVKVPKSITHEHSLQGTGPLLDEFLAQCSSLGERLGCLLVQLPPSLVFDAYVAESFFEALRTRFVGNVVIEPRHESWAQAQSTLIEHHIAQAAVDPGRFNGDHSPAGWLGMRYWRLHGSPKLYSSAYESEYLEHVATHIQKALDDGVPVWCIFDNTAWGKALGNALAIRVMLEKLG